MGGGHPEASACDSIWRKGLAGDDYVKTGLSGWPLMQSAWCLYMTSPCEFQVPPMWGGGYRARLWAPSHPQVSRNFTLTTESHCHSQ